MFTSIFLCTILFGWVQTAHVKIWNKTKSALALEYQWNSLDFQFPDNASRQDALDTNSYIPGAAEPFDVDIYPRIGVFLTLPRLRPGVPASLGYLSDALNRTYSSIIPYPNLRMHIDKGDCRHIHSVYRIKIDECNRLWAVDSGKMDGLHYCAPKLLAFDLSNDKLIISHSIDASEMSEYSRLIAPVVDIRNGKCEDTFVYIADVMEYGIVVYSHKTRTSWFVMSEKVHLSPEFGVDFSVVGTEADNFEFTLGNVDNSGDRKLYFHQFDSGHHGYIKTSAIRDPIAFLKNPRADFDGITILPYARARSKTEVMNKDGILFFHSGYDDTIHCWTLEPHNNYKPGQTDTVLATGMQVMTNLKIVGDHKDELLLITSIPSNQSMDALPSSDHQKYRILAVSIRDIIDGTKCGPIRPE